VTAFEKGKNNGGDLRIGKRALRKNEKRRKKTEIGGNFGVEECGEIGGRIGIPIRQIKDALPRGPRESLL